MIDLSKTSKARVYLGTFGGVLVCIVVAIFVDSFSFPDLTPQQVRTYVAKDILIPTVLGGTFFMILLGKIRQLEIMRIKLHKMATTDALTGVFNRGEFTRVAISALSNDIAGTASTCVLLLVDADHFKQVNDKFGHQMGDKALKLIAECVRSAIRPSDAVGRVGGEEFAVILRGTSAEQAARVAECIRSSVKENAATTLKIDLSVSLGGALVRGEKQYEILFALADRSLYEAKRSGRDRLVLAA